MKVADEGYEKHELMFHLKSSKMSSSLFLKSVLEPLTHICTERRISKDKHVHKLEMITAYVSTFLLNTSKQFCWSINKGDNRFVKVGGTEQAK